ncbi:MAG: transcriptional repressor [Deltaproteobacteria bacterium]|nr:transcriptional repressor [Deltaproteobacteria bacterium]
MTRDVYLVIIIIMVKVLVNMSGKMRETSQRRVILEELAKLKTHPTANEIYEIVRKRLPRISLGTIYRNLEFLSGSGLIQKLELAGTQKRFDGTVANHYHIKCVKCGRVDDLDLPAINLINDTVITVCDYEVLWHRLEFAGVCPECRSSKPDYIQ